MFPPARDFAALRTGSHRPGVHFREVFRAIVGCPVGKYRDGVAELGDGGGRQPGKTAHPRAAISWAADPASGSLLPLGNALAPFPGLRKLDCKILLKLGLSLLSISLFVELAQGLLLFVVKFLLMLRGCLELVCGQTVFQEAQELGHLRHVKPTEMPNALSATLVRGLFLGT